MGMFTNLSKVKLVGDYTYPKFGHYYVRLDSVKSGENRLKVKHIIINYTVVHALATSEPPPHHTVGEEACQFIKVSGNEYAEKDWAAFVTGVLGCDVSKLDDPDIRKMMNGMDSDDFFCNDDPAKGIVQPLRGTLMEVRFRAVPGDDEDKAGNAIQPKLFTRAKWVREVPPAEALKLLTPDQVTRFFPNNYLQSAAGVGA